LSKRYTWISVGGHVIVILLLILISGIEDKEDSIDTLQILEAEPALLPFIPEIAPPPEIKIEEKAKLVEEAEEVLVPKKPEIDHAKRKIIPKPKPKPKPKPLPKIKPALEKKLDSLNIESKKIPEITSEKKN